MSINIYSSLCIQRNSSTDLRRTYIALTQKQRSLTKSILSIKHIVYSDQQDTLARCKKRLDPATTVKKCQQ